MTAAHVTFTPHTLIPILRSCQAYKSAYRLPINVSAEVVVQGWAVTLPGRP